MGRRETFDPMKRYTCNRDFVYAGKPYKYGEYFEDTTNMRRFRQLYDARYLRMAEWDGPVFSNMPITALREWLVANGQPMLAHPRAPHQRLVERCKRVYAALKQPQVTTAPVPVAEAVVQEVPDGVSARHDDSESSGARVQGAPTEGRDLAPASRQRERIR